MTTWLTRITLDTRHKETRADLSDAVRIHHRLMTLAPNGLGDQARRKAGLLYRLDDTRTGLHLLTQTQFQPDTSHLPDHYGHTEVRDIDPLLNALTTGAVVTFRLAANTTKRLSSQAGMDEGKVVPLTGSDVDDWWLTRAARSGLTILTMRSHSEDSATGTRRDHQRVRHAITRFDGTAAVTDGDLLRAAIGEGVGRGKSYGCGLLSVAPRRSSQ